MVQLLMMLASDFAYLFTEYGYRIVDSDASKVFGDNGYVTLEDGTRRLKFVRDRGQNVLDFFLLSDTSERYGYSLDLFRKLIEKRKKKWPTGVLDEDSVAFMRNNIDKIHALFPGEAYEETKATLERLKDQRANELFGPIGE